MVYKKFQVYDWFKTLDGAKRIDFLNGMLHLCFPLELRFLGSCIEELARKDFTFLREAELKANSVQEIHQMRDLCDKITRSKIIVTLALLSSSNLDCAQLLYDILNVDISDLLEKMRDNNLDEKIADEFLLMLTMAANHPAFDFQMKSRMSQMYLLAEQKLKLNRVVLKESESEMFLIENEPSTQSSISNQSNNLLTTTKISDMDSENRNNLSQQISVSSRTAQDNTLVHVNNNSNCPILELNVDTNNNMNNDELNETKKSMKPVFTTSSSTSSVVSLDPKQQADQDKESSVLGDQKQLSSLVSSLSSTKLNKSENIGEVDSALGGDDEPILEASDFEGVKAINGTQIYKFIIRVKWSDNSSSEVEKTYSEFCEFNKQLTSLFPEELNGLIEGSQLVFRENQKEDFIKELPFVAEYCGKIATLPEIVRKSQFLRNFFRSKNLNTSVTEVKSPSVVNPSVNEDNKLADKLTASPVKATITANSPRLTEENKIASLKESKVSSSSLTKTLEKSEKIEPVAIKPVTPSASTTPAHKVVVSVAEVMNNSNNHSNNSSKPPLNLDNNNNKNSIEQSNNILTDSTNIKSVHNSRFQAPQQQNSFNQSSANSNNVAAASPPISISPSPLLTTTTGHQSTSNSVNNSRSNSPWSRNMPPPPVPAQSSQPLQMPLLPPNSMPPNQYYYHHHQYAGMRQQHQQQPNMFGKNNNKNGFAMSYGSYQNDDIMFPRHQINENFQSPIDDPQIDKYMKSNNKNSMETRKGMNNSKGGKSNGQHGKNNENSLIVETSMSSTNGPGSPKMQQSHQNSNNMRSSSSCSSSYQTPPPAQQQQQPGGMNQIHQYGNQQQSTSSNSNPLHLTSPSQHPTVSHSHYMHQILHNPHPHLVSLTSNGVPPPIPFPPPPNGSSSSSNLAANNGNNNNNSGNGNKHAQNSSQSHLHHNMPVTLLAPLLHPMPIAMPGHQQTILPSQFIAPGASNSHLYKSQSQKQFYNSANNSSGHQMNVNNFDGNLNNFSTTSDDEESTKGGNSTTRAQQQQNTDETSDNNGGLNRNNNKMTGGRVQNIQRVQRKSISFNDSANSGKANSTFNSGPSSTPKVQSSGLLQSDTESNNSKSNQAESAKKKDSGKDDKSEKEANGLMVNVNSSSELSTSAPVSASSAAKSPPVMATPSNMPLHPHPPMIPNFGQANNLYLPPNTLMPQFLLEQYGLGLPANISILPAPNNGPSGGNNNNTQQPNGQFNQFIAHMPPPNFNGPHLMPTGMHAPHPSHMHYMPNGSGSNSGNGANTNGTFLIPMMPPPTHPIQSNSNANAAGNNSSAGTSSSTPGNSPNQGQSEKTQQQSDQQQQQSGNNNNNNNGEQHSAMQPPHHLISPFNLHQMMLGPQNMGQQPSGPNGMNHGGNVMLMMMMGNGGQPGAPGSISFIQPGPPLHPSMHNGPSPVNSNLIPQQAQQQQPFYPPNQGAGKGSGPAAGMMAYPNHFQPPYLIQPMGAPGTAHQQQSISPMSPPMSHSLNRNGKSSLNNTRKKSCYNCGSMNHAAHECKEPTIESSMPSQSSAQFKLNYQPPTESQTNVNYSNSNGHSSSATSSNEPSSTTSESTSESSANKSTVSTSSPKTVTNAIKMPISAPLEAAVKN